MSPPSVVPSVGGLVDLALVVGVAVVEVVEAGVDRRARRAGRVRDARGRSGCRPRGSCRPAGCPGRWSRSGRHWSSGRSRHPRTRPRGRCGFCGSMTRSVAPWISSLVPLRRVQLVPPLFDSHTPYFTAVGADRAVVATAAANSRGVEVVGVGRVDDDGRDGLAGEEGGDVGPGDAPVGGLVDAVAVVAVTGQGTLTGAHVDQVVVARRNGQSADGLGVTVVRARRPDARGLVVGPDPTLGRPQDDRAVLADRQRTDPAGDGLEPVRRPAVLHDRVRALTGPGAAARGALGRVVGDRPRLGVCARPQGRGLLQGQLVVPGQQPAPVVRIAQLVERLLVVAVLVFTLGGEQCRGVIRRRSRLRWWPDDGQGASSGENGKDGNELRRATTVRHA